MKSDIHWTRRIVDTCIRSRVTNNGDVAITFMSDRQCKFLHLHRQCFFDCPYCEQEAMEYLRRR